MICPIDRDGRRHRKRRTLQNRTIIVLDCRSFIKVACVIIFTAWPNYLDKSDNTPESYFSVIQTSNRPSTQREGPLKLPRQKPGSRSDSRLRSRCCSERLVGKRLDRFYYRRRNPPARVYHR